MAQLTAVFWSSRVGVDCWIQITALELLLIDLEKKRIVIVAHPDVPPHCCLLVESSRDQLERKCFTLAVSMAPSYRQ